MARARKRIGLQASRLEYGYGVGIWKEAMAFAEESDVDLIVFPGRNLEAPHGYDYQYNRIFGYMNPENLDALVLVTTLISNYVGPDEILRMRDGFGGLPLVSFGTEIPGTPGVLIDNRGGVRGLVRHLAEEHGFGRIAFVKGPESNWEAQERFEAYRQELAALGIPFDPRLAVQGDFTPYSVSRALDDFFAANDSPPDAFMFANDEMAIRGAQLLAGRGLGGMPVTGFDDIAEAQAQLVPLTTVRQPLGEMARIAMRTAIDLLEGRQVPERAVLPAEPVIRSSCGCVARSARVIERIERCVEESGPGGEPGILGSALAALREAGRSDAATPENRLARIRGVAEGMLALSGPGGGGDRTGFLARFAAQLQEEMREGLDPADWQFILPAIAAAIKRDRGDGAGCAELSSLGRLCAAQASEMAAVRFGAERVAATSEMTVLQHVQFNLASIMHIEELVAGLRDQLPRLGIGTFLLSQYPEEWRHGRKTPWEPPPESRFAGGMEDGAKLRPLEYNAELYPSRVLIPPGTLSGDKRRNLAVFPLFFRETHFGTIVYELTRTDGYVYEMLTNQASAILRSISLFRSKEEAEERLRQAMAELEDFNKQLSDLSITDELTGLYNRRGFMRLAGQQLSLTRQMRKNSLLIYGDIDGLKGINDRYGHEEGDFAIKAIASALRQTFRSMDILGRMGGDEFTVFAANADEGFCAVLEQRLASALAEANARSGKPFALAISLGSVSCRPDSSEPLGDLLSQADARLYEKKKDREAGRRD